MMRRAMLPISPQSVAQTVEVSGSVSPTTERQILHVLKYQVEAEPMVAVVLAANQHGARQAAIPKPLHSQEGQASTNLDRAGPFVE